MCAGCCTRTSLQSWRTSGCTCCSVPARSRSSRPGSCKVVWEEGLSLVQQFMVCCVPQTSGSRQCSGQPAPLQTWPSACSETWPRTCPHLPGPTHTLSMAGPTDSLVCASELTASASAVAVCCAGVCVVSL